MDEQRIAQLAGRAEHLVALHNSPSYPVLKQIIEDRIRTETRRYVSTPVATQQGLDWGRGFLCGLDTVLRTIERGEKELERAIKLARALEEVEVG